MAEFREVFQDNTVRTNKAFAVVDINNSTKMKQKEAEQSWVNKTLALYGVVAEKVEDAEGRIVKFVGDGIMVVFDEDNAVSAINSAIRIQETLKKQREEGITDITVSIAIAYGSAVEFKILEEADFIGQTIDRAYRLCSAANANAIFIDSQIIDAAPMTRVTSVIGSALGHGPDQYRGTMQQVSLKGFSSPVTYYEICWDRDHFGVDSSFVSDQSVGETAPRGPIPAREPNTKEAKRTGMDVWVRGYVTSVGEKFGFIRSDETDYFFAPWFVFSDQFIIEKGAKVTFLVEDSIKEEHKKRARKIFLLDATIQGKVTRRVPNTNYGFIELIGNNNVYHSLFVLFRDMHVEEGEIIQCTIDASDRGPVGINPVRIAEDGTAGAPTDDLPDLPDLSTESA